ncbi:hypothetical protein JIG36_10240 [Actinoplanes sp. LDG1-06]|uniref:Uncharacterized protein n=1 Tax=Paractinoplanes ovalisporus TaxID=2810368 RepID=A0ABS2A877_9ACTN|nr:hypothetical protein [Actinoplanes ovalisporus]MBM2615935.1 hypothetical protein [Actinoplanes ovalisporus]
MADIVENGAVMDFPRLIGSLPGAPWLPPGSSAEFWAGDDLDIPRPTPIVRLLVTRGGKEFYCVPTANGLDLPTLFLGTPEGWRLPVDGVAELCRRILGAPAETRCIGYVRNIVPEPDESYTLPVPVVNILVFTPRDPTLEPVAGDGTWVTEAPDGRHWWPVVREALLG